jgi:hypothetical protein
MLKGNFGDRVLAGFAPSLIEGQIQFMKSLRMLVLILAVGVSPVFLMPAHGQQEVDPDHFDQLPAAKADLNTSKIRKNQHATAADHKARKHASTAAKRASRKPNRHEDQTFQSPFAVRALSSTSVESPQGAMLIALVQATQPLCLTKCRVAHGGAYCHVNG